VTTVSPTYRFTTVLIALLFALGGGVPTASATCMSAGAMGAKHCGGSESAQHCDGKMGETSAVCLTHHASQEAHTQYGSSLDPDLSGSGEPVLGSNRIRKTTAHHRPFSGRPLHRGTLLRARLGVWLE